MAFELGLESDQAEAVFRQILYRIESGTLHGGLIAQIAIVAAAFASAMAINWLLLRWAEQHRKEPTTGSNIKRRIWSFCLDIPLRVALPFMAMALVLIFSSITSALGLTGNLMNMPFCRLAHTLFGALASVRVVCYCVKRLFGNWFFLSDKVVSWTVWVLVMLHMTGALPRVIAWMKGVMIPIGNGNASLWSFLIGSLTVALTIGLARWLAEIFNTWLLDLQTTRLDGNLKIVVQRVATIFLYGTAILTALSYAGLDLTVLSVFGGALGVGLGFGLQKIASNYVSGFIVLLERSVKIGDLVTVSGISGTVSKMATRYTIIKQLNGTEHVVPNEMLVTSPVANMTYSSRLSRITVDASVAYGSDYARALVIMVECAKAQSRVEPFPKPAAVITAMGDSAVELQVGFWISDADAGTASLRSNITQAILLRFEEEGLEVPFNQLDVRMRND